MKIKLFTLISLFLLFLIAGSVAFNYAIKRDDQPSANLTFSILESNESLLSDDADVLFNRDNKMSVFPNPANGEANILINSINEMNDLNLFVTDFAGKTNLIKIISKVSKGDNYVTIDTREYRSGVYIVNGKSPDGVNYGTLRLIIKH
jgi:hypothetical protein